MEGVILNFFLLLKHFYLDFNENRTSCELETPNSTCVNRLWSQDIRKVGIVRAIV